MKYRLLKLPSFRVTMIMIPTISKVIMVSGIFKMIMLTRTLIMVITLDSI